MASRRTLTIAGLALLPVLVVAARSGYQAYWMHGAKREVLRVAEALARGEQVPELGPDLDPAIRTALATGYQVTGFDNIGFGFRAYEVRVRVAGGDQYIFDAIYLDGHWDLSCCARYEAVDLK